MFRWYARHKRFWIPPILLYCGILAFLAWKAATTASSPFEYALY